MQHKKCICEVEFQSIWLIYHNKANNTWKSFGSLNYFQIDYWKMLKIVMEMDTKIIGISMSDSKYTHIYSEKLEGLMKGLFIQCFLNLELNTYLKPPSFFNRYVLYKSLRHRLSFILLNCSLWYQHLKAVKRIFEITIQWVLISVN